jgi:hypothetical protein
MLAIALSDRTHRQCLCFESVAAQRRVDILASRRTDKKTFPTSASRHRHSLRVSHRRVVFATLSECPQWLIQIFLNGIGATFPAAAMKHVVLMEMTHTSFF